MTTLRIDATSMSVGDFHSDNRYFRIVANPSHRVMYGVRTISCDILAAGDRLFWRWQVGPVVKSAAFYTVPAQVSETLELAL
jgi:hypothetical protein